MSQPRSQALLQVVKKIPLFHGLSPRQVQEFLNVCQPRPFAPEEKVCGSSSPSDELFILISGRLLVKSGDGVHLATVEPVSTVGEMGVITRQPRSATVVAVEPSRTFVIARRQFEAVLEKHPEAALVVYRNIIRILADKIANDNVRTRQYVLDGLKAESRLRELQHAAEAALALLVRHSGMTRAEAEAQIAGERRAAYLEVMVVDDEPEVRRFAREALPDLGVVEAADGAAAVDLLQQHRPDPLIADLRMPRMDGFELLHRARRLHPDLPVYALSGCLGEQEVAGRGFDGFIAKPITIDRFRRIVHDVLVRGAPAAAP